MSKLVVIVDAIAKAVISEHAKQGKFTGHEQAFKSCVELLAGLTEYEFPVLTPDIIQGEIQRWSIYWSVSVAESDMTIELLVANKAAILTKTYYLE
ncbi:hypothetical protein L2737_02270 [Shewanella electrodiphila]|uniref:Uncharacterized protein n=1 Tax=Shewanella electrodiphila TaxID=934143 RepID=A0ABT0KJZ1_9GAMM|nr:hypothetical protein [Shewanella electrodiphila]MCL1044158.1 hypothetical protein [Shewanella electrodiphila]